MSDIIGVCGGSGSGKTTLARLLARALGPEQTLILSFDSYYRDYGHLSPTDRALVNFDHPNSLDLELLVDHLDALRSGVGIGVPVYDFVTHTRTDDIELIEPTRFVILEGILAFTAEDVRQRLDHRIFRHCPPGVRFERRLLRDVADRGRSPESVELQWRTTVEPMHRIHVDPFAHHAQVVTRHGYDLDRAVRRIADTLLAGRPLTGCLDDSHLEPVKPGRY